MTHRLEKGASEVERDKDSWELGTEYGQFI